ncbi:bifunctional DNA-formamidopyrimidine glycosylase/DNA-(apurinic or apyrimidinic site) lyase [Candidatus Woesebacteria bacterium]|nr:bifunctional DNA-formamidopyrimidine glycosylase/DNA-(apurinic or apyrimidinic site) lyase [Candidatus Woesebacteria bacterium]
MPELPEVETIARRLAVKLIGRRILFVAVLRSKSWGGQTELVIGQKITVVGRRAKILIIEFDQSLVSILIHLKMTGQLIHVDKHKKKVGGGHPTTDWIDELPGKHTRVILKLDDDSTLYFNDMRVFGWMKVVTEAEKTKELANYGPDIIDSKITDAWFYQQLQKKSQSIKQVIMDSSFIAGVGNIYACDGLHLSGISPTRSAKSLNLKEASRLLEALQTVINLGVELGGATIQNYKNVDGLAGKYQLERRAYARENEPCIVCGLPITRIKQGGRSTFYCSHCQK